MMRNMKIAIDIRNIGKGRTGDEMVFFELVRNLAKIDHKNTYHLLIDERTDEELENITRKLETQAVENFHIVSLGSGNKFVWNAWSVPRYCRRENIHIYHTQYIIPFFMPAQTKIVTHVHDVSFRVYKDLITKKDAFFLNLLIPYALKYADRIIAVSQFTKDEIIKYYRVPDKKISIVYNASHLSCSEVNSEYMRKKYSLPKKFILMLGTMQPRKNIPFAVRAFAQIADTFPDVSVVLAGKKAHNFDREIQQLINERPQLKNRIIFTGYIDEEDKCAVYDLATVFVFPSLYEGFGVPILEAFHVGTPVIASDIEPHREVACDCAQYFDPTNIDHCARILYDVLDGDKIGEAFVDCAKQRAMEFSWELSAKKLYTIYESL